MESLPVGIQFVGTIAIIGEVLGGIAAIVVLVLAYKGLKKLFKYLKDEGTL